MRHWVIVHSPAVQAVRVKGYLSEAERISNITGCCSEGEWHRALDRARLSNEQPRLVKVIRWAKGYEYAAVEHPTHADMVKIVDVRSQRLLIGKYDETSWPIEEAVAKLKELGAVHEP